MKRFILAGMVGLALIGLAMAVLSSRSGDQPAGKATGRAASPGEVALSGSATTSSLEGFSRATGPRMFVFPDDHGPHLDYQTEWWYYTGNLETEEGRRFGYQFTIFRRALLPPSQVTPRPSQWGSAQVYMAHLALTDVTGERHQAFERLGRGAAGIAGAQAAPFQVWLEDWQVQEVSPVSGQCPDSVEPPCAYRLTATQGDLSLDLQLLDRKGPVLQGDQGYSRKGPEAGQASYYYSLPRLETQGAIRVGDEQFQVSGLSWMDHEFSTSVLSEEQVGWDWFSFQLEDGSELMVFQLRQADGSSDPFSSGTLIAPDGSTTHLAADDFQIRTTGSWTSPDSNGVYPSGWIVTVPSAGLTLTVEPVLSDQELNLTYSYWEGAVDVSGEQNGQPLQGRGFVELTGYAGSMGGEF